MYRQLYSFVCDTNIYIPLIFIKNSLQCLCPFISVSILLQEDNETGSFKMPPGFCYTSRPALEFSLAGSVKVNISFCLSAYFRYFLATETWLILAFDDIV